MSTTSVNTLSIAGLVNPQCGVPTDNYVDAPNGAAIVDTCGKLSANITVGVMLAIAALIVLLSNVQATPTGGGAPQPVLSWLWALVPLAIAGFALAFGASGANAQFAVTQATFRASGLSKADWLAQRNVLLSAQTQAAATRSAGDSIANSLAANKANQGQ